MTTGRLTTRASGGTATEAGVTPGAPQRVAPDEVVGGPDHFYVMAYTCGHSIWFSRSAHSGIDYCAVCNEYVGVIVTRKERRSV